MRFATVRPLHVAARKPASPRWFPHCFWHCLCAVPHSASPWLSRRYSSGHADRIALQSFPGFRSMPVHLACPECAFQAKNLAAYSSQSLQNQKPNLSLDPVVLYKMNCLRFKVISKKTTHIPLQNVMPDVWGCISQHLTKECNGHATCHFIQNAPFSCFVVALRPPIW